MSDLVQIAQFYDPEEAYCAQGYLKSHGVETIIQNDHHLTMAPWLRIALGGFCLLAPSTQEDQARLALDLVPETSSYNTASNAVRSDHSSHTDKGRRNLLWAPVAFLTGIPFILRINSKWDVVVQACTVAAFAFMFIAISTFWL